MRKYKIKKQLAGIFSAAILSANIVNAQDTTAIKSMVIDSTVAGKTTVVSDTVATAPIEKRRYLGEFGVRYMPNFSSISLRNVNGDVVEANVTMSNGFGIMFGYNLSKYVGIQAEINYDRVSQKYEDEELNRQVSISYINIPLLLAVNTDKTCPVIFGVVIGPQFGINMGSDFSDNGSNTSDTLQAELAVKAGDVGLAYGAGFGFSLNQQNNIRLDIGFRGVYGLVDMSGTTTGSNSYNILVKGSRKSYGGYLGITFLF